jgi:putative hydrolase of the HAD superfamily
VTRIACGIISWVLAIVFDFFGTRTDPAAEMDRRTASGRTAEALGIPADRF